MAKETTNKHHAEEAPKWLRTIQLNSWEAELLISALVLYALFQIPEILSSFALQNFPRGSRINNLINLLTDAIHILSFGYILHIMVRGTWVASVGLSYVFPKGVNPVELRFKGKFKEEVKRNGSLVKMVLRLEELSSLVYGISFIFFGTLIGFGAFLFSFLFFFEWAQPYVNQDFAIRSIFGILTLFYFFLAVIVFFDFLTNGLLRRKEWSADWFYYVARVFRIFTLSFLYRRSLLVLISNVTGWKKYLIPFIILGVLAGYKWMDDKIAESEILNYYQRAEVGDYNMANYESLRDGKDHLAVTIQSDIVRDNVLRIFLKDLGTFGGIHVFEDKLVKKTKWDEMRSDSISLYFKKRLSITIDDQIVRELKWSNSQHPQTKSYGFMTFIDIDSLSRGEHYLHLGIDTAGMSQQAKKVVQKDGFSMQEIGNIYFFYDKP